MRAKIFWRTYFVLMLLMYGVYAWALLYFDSWIETTGADYLNTPTVIVGLLGVYGYAFSQRIVGPTLWKAFFIVTLAVDGGLFLYGLASGWTEIVSSDF